MNVKQSDPLANRLLASLTGEDYAALRPALLNVDLAQGTTLHEAGNDVENICFPHSGMISLLAVMGDGQAIEVATVGCEGVVGATAGLGLSIALDRAVVQLPVIGSQIGVAAFRTAVLASSGLRDLIIANNQVLLAQVQTTAACNALHPIEARLCRWILQAHDRNGSDVIRLTQEFLSEMLAVRRTSVSDVAGKLQAAGMIRYSRGAIEIVDRTALVMKSCECYETIVKITMLILPAPQ